MTPKTQSVCKWCADLDKQFAHLKSANTGAWQYRNEHGHWVTCGFSACTCKAVETFKIESGEFWRQVQAIESELKVSNGK